MGGLLPNQQIESCLPPFLLPQDLPLHTLLPLQLPLPPCPSKTSNLYPYATLISLGDRPGTLPKQTAPGSALLVAEPVTPKAMPTPQPKKGATAAWEATAWASAAARVPQRGSNNLPCSQAGFAPGLPLHQDWCQDALNLNFSFRGCQEQGKMNKISSEFSPPGETRN